MDAMNPLTSAAFQRAMEGWLTDLPPEDSILVRVFFSSTFTDMSVERNKLVKDAVPYLRDYCKDRGLDFQVVDMRWGVREDATTDICLQEIVSKIQQAHTLWSSFLGDRYGSRLLPLTIPVTEYRSLRRLASWMDQEDFAVVDKWYLVDTNAVPAVYQILPITALCPNYNDPNPKNRIIRQQHHQTWDRDQAKMMNAFQVVCDEAHKRKVITDEEYSKYYTSVTHKEVKKGLQDSPDVKKMNVNTALSFHRNLNQINIKDKLAKRFTDLTEEGEIDDKAAELRQHLKNDVVTSYLHEACISQHTIDWTEYGVHQTDPDHDAYLKSFCDIFIAKMMNMIDKWELG